MRRSELAKSIRKHPLLYIMVLPGMIYFLLFYFVPILGNVIAWMDYNYVKGFAASPWVGWKHFETMFNYSEFFRILRNTVVIGLLTVAIGVPVPVVLALLLNEIRANWFKRVSQTVLFLPFFLSWVIISRLVYSVLHPQSGIVNMLITAVGAEPVFFMVKSALFPLIVVAAGTWQSAGFSAIIYLAAISTIDPDLYESAEIDGASAWQKTASITIPFLVPQILVMLLLSIGNFLNTGYNQIETLYNPLVRSTGEILINYIFNAGINRGRYSFATAVGMFQAIVGVILVLGGHFLSLRLTGRGLFYVPKSKNGE